MNWDDLRIIAAVRDEGTYAAAGARLRIDETTVARRMARIQASLGITLFNAVDGTRKPTSHCDAVLSHVNAIARHVAEIGHVGKTVRGPVGKFRLASTTSIAEQILAPHATRLLTTNPGLSLDFMTSPGNVNFSRWEADFAIRLRKPDKGDFTISKLVDMQLYLFEPTALPAGMGEPIVCRFPEELDHTPDARFLAARGLDAKARCRTGDYRIMRELIRSHSAVGILPDYLCGDLLRDRKLRITPLPTRRDVWLLVQSHLKRDPAARLVIDWIRKCFANAWPVAA
ncbi:MAG TPA: LysR family transcriptional regulator [Reyranella sp.]|jgi:DNA-binding transcriptional LysR family regulator|nr:LysR family transcriptional regulator [Reyranella sp.]